MRCVNFSVYFHNKIPEIVKDVVIKTAENTFTGVNFKAFEYIPFNIQFAYDSYRGQFNGVKILEKAIEDGYRFFLIVIPYDLFVPHLNFVFGVAEPYYGAIISTWRLQLTDSTKIFLERIQKTVKHELGHVFGLPHCKNECVMRFANSLFELDLKYSNFCERCKKMLVRLGVIKS